MSDENPSPEKGQEGGDQKTPVMDKSIEARLEEKGLKDVDALLSSYDEAQATLTDQFTEIKELKEELEAKQVQPEAPYAPARQPEAKSFDEMFDENPEKAIEATVYNSVAKAQKELALREEQGKDDFDTRLAYAQKVERKFPHLANTPEGVKTLFSKGDELREKIRDKEIGSFIKDIFGEDMDKEKLKRLANASDDNEQNTGSFVPEKTTNLTKREESHAAQVQKAVKEGDPRKILDLEFKKILG